MTPPAQLAKDYNDLKRAFGARPTNLKKCGELLTRLKLGLIGAELLPVLPTPNPNLDDLVVVRDILEIGAFWSIRSKDVPSFDRYFSQLQTFYTDYSSILPPSPREHPLLGLNLIRLLTQNRIADFHTTLEALRLPPDAAGENAYIAHPVAVERWLMEGSYSKVWGAREEAPAEEYRFFVDSLMVTIRNEIASCEETAYDSLPLKDAATLLFFTNRTELITFAQQRGWQVNLLEETITFAKKSEEKTVIPKAKLISLNLAYARELEQIV
ncbi:COP9 signalosome [Phellopilus nigrolimitatus]|nr:COP9 signalosome [Phellopilus nigrolimitatus]